MVVTIATLLLALPPEAIQRTRLEWRAVADCPPREAFVAALHFRTARAEIVDATDATSALISIRIERVGRKFRGALVLDLPTGVTQREASSPRCSSVVEALSLISALVIDPEHAKTGPLPAELPSAPPPSEPPPTTPPPVDPPPVEPPPKDEPVVKSLEPPVIVAPPPPTAEPISRVVRLGAALHVTTAISGLVDTGATAHLSYERSLFLARLELGGGSGRVVTSAQGEGQYPFHVLANVSAGIAASFGMFRTELLATLQAMVFTVRAPRAAQPVEALRLSPSLGPSVGLMLNAGRWTFGVRALTGLNLRTDTYVIDPEGGVFTNPLVFLQPSLTAVFAL